MQARRAEVGSVAEHGGVGLSRRRLVVGTTGGAALIFAAACGAARGPQEGARPAASQPAKLLWQIKFNNVTYRELAEWAVGDFRKRYPNATIDLMGDEGNVEKTLTVMVAGEGPDVIHSWGHNFWQYAAKGMLYNHNELIKDYKKADIDDFVDYQWKGFVIPTTSFRFGMPMYINMMALYYNKTLFAKRGQKEPTVDWNHDDYAQMLKQMTFQDGAQKVWGGYIPATGFDRFQNHVLMYGGNVVDPKDLTKSTLHMDKAQQGLEWLRARLWTDQTLAPLDTNRRTWQPTGQLDGFYQGAIATLEDGVGAPLLGISRNMTGDWNMAHVPKGPARRAVLGTTDGWGLWRGTKYKDVAWELIKFITTREYNEQQARIDLRVPSRKSVLDVWTKIVRERFPVLQNVNLKVVTDALTVMNYPTVDEIFLCQAEAARVIGPALAEVFRDGKQPVTYFRDIKPQLDEAARSCGTDPAKIFK